MCDTRIKIKIRKTQNTLKTSITQASIADSDDKSTQAGSLIGSNDDLLTQILLRLPVISICRFKTVSQHWRSLLSDRRFTLVYDKASVSHGLFVLNLYIPFDVEIQNAPPFRSLDFYHDDGSVRIVQSCNGLLLCCRNGGKEHTCNYYVINPTTMQLAVIPSIIGGPDASKTIRFMGLAFHQSDCVHYKVICFRNTKPNGNLFQIQIYSSDTGKWRISHQSFSEDDSWFSFQAYCYGAIHWIPSYFEVLSFKLDEDQFQKLLLPGRVSSSGEGSRPLYFGESGGHIHLVESGTHESNSLLNVYEMLSDCSGWFIKYQVELHELLVAYPEMIRRDQNPSRPQYHYDFEVFDVVRGEDEDTFMVVRIHQKIIRYNVVEMSFKQIFDSPYHLRYQPIQDEFVHRYTETLFSF